MQARQRAAIKKMRKYSDDDEKKIRLQSLVREWHSSGFLEADQRANLQSDLDTGLRRINPWLRLILFIFTAIIAGASIGLFVEMFNLDDEASTATVLPIAAVVCFVLAEYLISRFKLYHFGVEEALAVASVVLLCIAAFIIVDLNDLGGPSSYGVPFVVALAVGAAGALAIYLRFGYIYAAIAAMICAGAMPFQMDITSDVARVAVAAMFAGVFLLVRPKRLQFDDEFPGDHYAIIQAGAWLGLYLAINLQIGNSRVDGAYYWLTYALTWLLPIIGLTLALPSRDRFLLDVNLALALVTLVTNKPYLGLTRRAWDPMLFGLFLLGTAIVIRRWLSSGPEGQRYGFTSKRLLAGDERLLAAAGTASAVFQTDVSERPPEPEPVKPEFGGGRSGGAGASGNF
jgi:hypothetical protein